MFPLKDVSLLESEKNNFSRLSCKKQKVKQTKNPLTDLWWKGRDE